jgi:tetratricopeptide (TPR) repeat protein
MRVLQVASARLWCTLVASVCFLAGLGAIVWTVCMLAGHAQGQSTPESRGVALDAILELPPDDWATIPADNAVRLLSHVLSEKRSSLSQSKLVQVLERRGDALAAMTRYAEAKRDYEEALQLRPKSVELRWRRARMNAHLGLVGAAIKELTEITTVTPSYAPAHASLASGYLAEGKPREAIALATRAIEINRKCAQAYYCRGLAYLADGSLESALADMNRYVELAPIPSPDPGEAYYIRGFILNRLGDHELAIQNLALARQLDAESYRILVELWNAHDGLGNIHMAAKLADDLLRLEPDKIASLLACAESSLSTNKPELALQFAQKAFANAPKEPAVNFRLGKAYAALGKYKSAYEHFDNALEAQPNHENVLASKAALLTTCPDASFRDGKKALEVATDLCKRTNWNKPRYIATLAAAHAECGEYGQALKLVQEALNKVGPSLRFRDELERMNNLFLEGKPVRLEVSASRTPTQPP